MLSRPPRLTPDVLAALHRRQEAVIDTAHATSPPPLEGAGIVMVAGGGRAFTNAWVSLTNLRDVHGCQLPIQIWHLGRDELSPVMREALRRFDVELVDAFQVRRQHPMRRLGPWECKCFAMLHSPFRHVILLDADNVPLIDPTVLLRSPEYAATGAIFWPDNHSHLPASPVWQLFDVTYRQELEVESGQLVVDTERCWAPLNLAAHYNAWSDIYYRYIYGDKETFHFAWRRLEQAYATPAERPRTVYCDWETPNGSHRMTAALEQSDFRGRAIFHHRTGAKWSLHGLNPTTGRHHLDAICHAAIEDLRGRWDGRIADDLVVHTGQPPSAPPSEGMRCRFRRLGVDEREIAFGVGGQICGGDTSVRSWRVDGSALVLAGDHADTCRLTPEDDGVWRGRGRWYQQDRIELVPLD